MPTPDPVHFIAGLPRSGSTLLNALLAQNPGVVTSGYSSPVAPMMIRLSSLMVEGEHATNFMPAQKHRILRQILSAYYGETGKRIVIDTNRDWCSRLGLIAELYPHARIVACVRDPVRVVDSLERLIVRDPLLASRLVPIGQRSTQHDRLDHLLSRDGVFGYAWRVLIEAFHGPFADRLILVDYENLARNPHAVLHELTHLLNLPPHRYNIEQVTGANAQDHDAALNTPDLHRLRDRVSLIERPCILPPSVIERLAGGMFWRKADARKGAAHILG